VAAPHHASRTTPGPGSLPVRAVIVLLPDEAARAAFVSCLSR
jgi:hypothetical protein